MRLVHFAKYSLLAAGVALAGGVAGIATAGTAAAQGWGNHNHGGGFNNHGGGWNRGRDWRPHRPPGWGFVPPHRGPRCTIQYRVVPGPYGPVQRPFRVCF